MISYIVLVTSGKHESVDAAQVHVFDSFVSAADFCRSKNTGKKKYWTKAEIVNEGESVELGQPEDE